MTIPNTFKITLTFSEPIVQLLGKECLSQLVMLTPMFSPLFPNSEITLLNSARFNLINTMFNAVSREEQTTVI